MAPRVCVCVLNNPDDMHQLIHCFSILPSKAADINLITEKKKLLLRFITQQQQQRPLK